MLFCICNVSRDYAWHVVQEEGGKFYILMLEDREVKVKLYLVYFTLNMLLMVLYCFFYHPGRFDL